MKTLNKKKIVNDPVYGFINIPHSIVFDLIEHSYFQRLRRIRQLGMTELVYPGAVHSRFQHALGAMHLMTLAIEVLKQKGNAIPDEEAEAACIAILLHDIGHGPFSHALESNIVSGVSHEQLSLLLMQKINSEFNNKLQLAIELFRGKYHKKFLHQLISSQLDMDRLDYLRRDSFFTGVSEGVVSSDRIIKMLEVHNDELVVEAKGIYSIEKFLIARRLMYWQVYLHKTVLSAELMLIQVLRRARTLIAEGLVLNCSDALYYFLSNSIAVKENDMLLNFTRLDDTDIIHSLKLWSQHSDIVLSYLAGAIINRRLLKVQLQKESFDTEQVERLRKIASEKMNISASEAQQLVFTDVVSNNAYSYADDQIHILIHGNTIDIARASDMLNHQVLSKTVTKNILCYPKEISGYV